MRTLRLPPSGTVRWEVPLPAPGVQADSPTLPREPWPGPAHHSARGQCQADRACCLPGARPKRTQRLSAETWGLLRLPLERVSGAQGGQLGPLGPEGQPPAVRSGARQRVPEAGAALAELPPPTPALVCTHPRHGRPTCPLQPETLDQPSAPREAPTRPCPLPLHPRVPPAVLTQCRTPKPYPATVPSVLSAPCPLRLCPGGAARPRQTPSRLEAGQGRAPGPLSTYQRWELYSPGGVS